MIHAASRQALAAARERLNGVLETLDSRDGEAEKTLASELYATADLLAGQPRLRRTLADPSTDAGTRGGLARTLLGSRLSAASVSMVVAAVEQRWSSPWDLTDSLEILADDALLASALKRGELDSVEDELFRFERILAASGELSSALDEAIVPAERRVQLLHSVLDGKASAITVELVAHAVASGRKRSVQLAIDDLLEASAMRRDRSVARVLSATELTAEQTRRLASALSGMYGRPIDVRTAVDPAVRGGLVVRVGDEVIDGTVASRLAAARSALAG
ncbi:MAG: F-type H+-transporting ATPase subunit delta [Pseudonocardiales bacterium]|jgi:F-type H+-transporting ATPase subunit delta|nr:F-type H+-transporting ATPase subunit delta [Pseudonocardiales bacterium]MDQ1751724.1 F-type H+-transporting ATPase subunit delta [Pseudonocardiales bacterium]